MAKQCKKIAKASNDHQKLTPRRKRFVDEYCIDFNGTQAAIRAGIKVNNYYSSEIDKYAIQIANKNYPQDAVNRLGDFIIRNYKESEKIKEPIEGIKRLVEGLRKDVKKL